MKQYKLQLKQFAAEWEQMQSSLPVAHSVLEIGEKSPEVLLQEMILQMESEFKPVPEPWSFCRTLRLYISVVVAFYWLGLLCNYEAESNN